MHGVVEWVRWEAPHLERTAFGVLESGEEEFDLAGGEVGVASVGGGGGAVLVRHGWW